MRISELEGRRAALWGWGREGRAAYRVLRSRLPDLPLTLFCSQKEALDARALGDASLAIDDESTAKRLSAFDVVIKSPGISPYCPEALAAAERGTRFVGGTALWFAERPDARTICVTGTKGKSTTTALIAHLLRAGGHRTALAGNIGLPLLELVDGEAEFWTIELSSYQTRDVAASGVRPEVAVVTNVFPEHLDWHGSEQRYIADKLALLAEAQPCTAVLNANDKTLTAFVGAHPAATGSTDQIRRAQVRSYEGNVVWFNRADGWHLRDAALYRGDVFVLDASAVPLPGRHNRNNLCAALAAIDALGVDTAALAQHAATFQPLPHRLQTLGSRDGITYVNDSISTTPHATLAALDVYRDQRVALLVGGHDRGLDWSDFAAAMRMQAPHAIVTMGHGVPGQNGDRIHALLEPMLREGRFRLEHAGDLEEAVALAGKALAGDGVTLLSPGAPSFGAYRDYTERGRDFARIGGFDRDAIAGIPGLGIV